MQHLEKINLKKKEEKNRRLNSLNFVTPSLITSNLTLDWVCSYELLNPRFVKWDRDIIIL